MLINSTTFVDQNNPSLKNCGGVGHLNAILVQEEKREGCQSLELIDALSWAFDFLDTMQRKVLG